ncbi:MAG: hypothetical protein LIR35_03080 [Bacteroidota bacterium]|nr:hypothetical protein [Bacteroidota bacterium]
MKKLLFIASAVSLMAVSCCYDPAKDKDEEPQEISEYSETGINQFGDKPVRTLYISGSDGSECAIRNFYEEGRLVDCMVGDDLRFIADYGEKPIFHVYSYDEDGRDSETARLTGTVGKGLITSLSMESFNSNKGVFEETEVLNYKYDSEGRPVERTRKLVGVGGGSGSYQFVWNGGNIVTISTLAGGVETESYSIAYNDRPNKSGIIPMVILMDVDPFFLIGDFYLENYPVSISKNGDPESAVEIVWHYDNDGLPVWAEYDGSRIAFEY